jgi:hypothetical protein
MFDGLVNILPILKDLALTSPNVELPEIKKKCIQGFKFYFRDDTDKQMHLNFLSIL